MCAKQFECKGVTTLLPCFELLEKMKLVFVYSSGEAFLKPAFRQRRRSTDEAANSAMRGSGLMKRKPEAYQRMVFILFQAEQTGGIAPEQLVQHFFLDATSDEIVNGPRMGHGRIAGSKNHLIL